MSYGRHTSMTRLDKYRAQQFARMEEMDRAIDEGRTTTILSSDSDKTVELKLQHAIPLLGRRGRELGSRPPLSSPVRNDGVVEVQVFSGHTSKTQTALVVEMATNRRPPVTSVMRTGAAIRVFGKTPEDGQLFSYNAATGQLVPVLRASEAKRRSRLGRKQDWSRPGNDHRKEDIS